MAFVTWLVTDVLFFGVKSFLAFLTEVTSVQEPRHGGNDIEMVVMKIQVHLFIGFRSFKYDSVYGNLVMPTGIS